MVGRSWMRDDEELEEAMVGDLYILYLLLVGQLETMSSRIRWKGFDCKYANMNTEGTYAFQLY